MKATTTKSRSLKTSEFQEKIVGYRTKLKKKKKNLQPPEILACWQGKYEMEKATNKYHWDIYTGINYKK